MDREEWKAVFEKAYEAAYKDYKHVHTSENYICMSLLSYIKNAL